MLEVTQVADGQVGLLCQSCNGEALSLSVAPDGGAEKLAPQACAGRGFL